MKIMNVFLVSLICIQFFACNNDTEPAKNPIINTNISKMKITIGTTVFTATLNDNAAATAFKAMLPLTVDMNELNGNEKYYYFSTNLPTNVSSGDNIKAGDLMLYDNSCLVLFYKNLNTSYHYTRIGRIDNISGLVTAVGSGNVTIKYEIQ